MFLRLSLQVLIHFHESSLQRRRQTKAQRPHSARPRLENIFYDLQILLKAGTRPLICEHWGEFDHKNLGKVENDQYQFQNFGTEPISQ